MLVVITLLREQAARWVTGGVTGVDRVVRALSLTLLVGLFLFSGTDKLLHYGGFVTALGSYVVLPRGVAPYIAPALIGSELWIAVGLMIQRWRPSASALGAVLLLVFAVALFVNRYYNPGAICGCWFTLTLGKSTALHVTQNLLLAAVAV